MNTQLNKKSFLILNETGSSLIAIMVVVAVISAATFSILHYYDSSLQSQRKKSSINRVNQFKDNISSNFSKRELCELFIANGNLSLDNGNVINLVKADPTNSGQKFSAFNFGYTNNSGIVETMMKNDFLTDTRLKVTEDPRLQCTDAGCPCVKDSSGNCFDADAVAPGIQIRRSANIILSFANEDDEDVHLAPRKIPIYADFSVAGNLIGCELVNSPAQQCADLGGQWSGGSCNMALEDFNCGPGDVATKDSNGDGLPDCKPAFMPAKCPIGEYVRRVSNGTVQCGIIGYTWLKGPWGACVAGLQTRNVRCINASRKALVVPDANCLAAKPNSTQVCFIYSWVLGACVANLQSYECRDQFGGMSADPPTDCGAQPADVDCTVLSDCVAGGVSWSQAGLTCSAMAPATAHGANTGALNDGAPDPTGSASFTCNNGTFQIDAGANCVALSAVWSWVDGPCNLGNIFYECRDQLNNLSGNPAVDCNFAKPGPEPKACPMISDCIAQVVTWTANGLTCTANAPATAHNAVTPVLNDLAPDPTGTATFRCNNGNFEEEPGSVCKKTPFAYQWVSTALACPVDYVEAGIIDDTDSKHALNEDASNPPFEKLCVTGVSSAGWAAVGGCGAGEVAVPLTDNDGLCKINESNGGKNTQLCLGGLTSASWFVGGCPAGWTDMGNIIDDSDASHHCGEDEDGKSNNQVLCVQ